MSASVENPVENSDRDFQTAQKPVLKILQKDGQRQAVRLESIFWSELKVIAADRGTKTSRLVFALLNQLPEGTNKTSFLRCLCMDSLRRRQQPLQTLGSQGYDMMALIAACPSPVAIITIARKLVAINPAFSDLAARLRMAGDGQGRAIHLSFSESVPKLVDSLLNRPQSIPSCQVGIQLGESRARQFPARFALADRAKGTNSLIVMYLQA
jgi:predicted DNA-binding ribbon-helix-helix protein